MSELGLFQAALVRELQGAARPGEDAAAGPLFPRGIAVHRNTAIKGLVDALADNYPTVERLVGREWFVACATEYVRAHPPTLPMLALYGVAFADFLGDFAPAAALPYLPDVARIDRMWTESHLARDAHPLAGDALAHLAPAELSEQRLTLHPAARCGWLSHSAVTIWLKNRPPAPAPTELEVDDAGEGALLTRPRGVVECIRLDAAAWAFLTRVREGATLGAAAAAALAADPGAEVARYLAQFIASEAFALPDGPAAGEFT